jgi:hypothetical protein
VSERARLSFGARALLLCIAGCLLAQTHDDVSEIWIGAVPQTPIAANKFTAETRLVDIPVVVRDAHGHPVAGLTKADFAVYDSGKRQTIASFAAIQWLILACILSLTRETYCKPTA